jgi:hypothetical protein
MTEARIIAPPRNISTREGFISGSLTPPEKT